VTAGGLLGVALAITGLAPTRPFRLVHSATPESSSGPFPRMPYMAAPGRRLAACPSEARKARTPNEQAGEFWPATQVFC